MGLRLGDMSTKGGSSCSAPRQRELPTHRHHPHCGQWPMEGTHPQGTRQTWASAPGVCHCLNMGSVPGLSKESENTRRAGCCFRGEGGAGSSPPLPAPRLSSCRHILSLGKWDPCLFLLGESLGPPVSPGWVAVSHTLAQGHGVGRHIHRSLSQQRLVPLGRKTGPVSLASLPGSL